MTTPPTEISDVEDISLSLKSGVVGCKTHIEL